MTHAPGTWSTPFVLETRTSGPGVGERGSAASRATCLRYVLRHPIAFRQYWVDRVFPVRHWHRYYWTNVVFAAGTADTIVTAGRGAGKSRWLLEPLLVHAAINKPGEETVLTAFRKTHITDRMERIVDYFERIPFFRAFFLRKVSRAPIYDVSTRQDHHLYGIPTGDDPEARQIVGKHASLLAGEEFQQYADRAWIRLQGAKDPRGAVTFLIGVPDGRLDTPFRRADTEYTSFKGRRFRVSSRSDPFFNQAGKQSLIERYRGEDTDAFKQEVDAQWGSPSFSAWNMDLVYACTDPVTLPLAQPSDAEPWYCIDLRVRGPAYRASGSVPESIGPRLPGRRWRTARTVMAVDPGYSQRSDVGVFQLQEDAWYLVAHVKLEQKMEIDDQVGLIDFLGRFYDVERIAIDSTDGEGRDMARLLELRPRWAARAAGATLVSPIVRVSFNDSDVLTYARDEATGDVVPVKDTNREIGTRRLRDFVSRREIRFPRDEAILGEFNSEIEVTSPTTGFTRIVTNSRAHTVDMFRVLVVMLFRENPPIPPLPEERPWEESVEMGEWSQPGESVWSPRDMMYQGGRW